MAWRSDMVDMVGFVHVGNNMSFVGWFVERMGHFGNMGHFVGNMGHVVGMGHLQRRSWYRNQ